MAAMTSTLRPTVWGHSHHQLIREDFFLFICRNPVDLSSWTNSIMKRLAQGPHRWRWVLRCCWLASQIFEVSIILLWHYSPYDSKNPFWSESSDIWGSWKATVSGFAHSGTYLEWHCWCNQCQQHRCKDSCGKGCRSNGRNADTRRSGGPGQNFLQIGAFVSSWCLFRTLKAFMWLTRQRKLEH